MRTAHGAEMNGFCRFARKRLIVVFASGFWVEAEVELIFPAEFETRF